MDTTPKNDIIFKALFGNQKHPRLLIHLLNSIIDTASPITGVTIRQSELSPELIGKKGVRLDVLAETQDKRLINVEIQKKNEHNIKEPSLFHWSKIFSGQAIVREKYENLKQTICINIIDFPLFEDGRYWHKNFLTDSETHEKLTELLEIHFFELPKIKKKDADSAIMFWLEFINNPESEKIKNMYRLEAAYQEAKETYEKAIADPKVQEMIRIQEKGEMDYKDALAHAKDNGREEGERKKALETAKAMLKDGLSIDMVAKYTGLPIEEIKRYS